MQWAFNGGLLQQIHPACWVGLNSLAYPIEANVARILLPRVLITLNFAELANKNTLEKVTFLNQERMGSFE